MSRDILSRVIGNVYVTVEAKTDRDPDLSFLGEYSDFRQPTKASEKLVHRDTEYVLDHHGIWRDQLGRIQAEPDYDRHSQDYQYIWCDNGHERVADAVRDAQRLERINDGIDWAFGLVARVYYHGKAIGHDSCWGYVGYSEAQMDELAREHVHNAIADAKQWLKIVAA